MTKTTKILLAAGAFAAAFSFHTSDFSPVLHSPLAWEQAPYPTPLPGDDDKTQKAAGEAEAIQLAWEQPPYPTPLPGDDFTEKATVRDAAIVA